MKITILVEAKNKDVIWNNIGVIEALGIEIIDVMISNDS